MSSWYCFRNQMKVEIFYMRETLGKPQNMVYRCEPDLDGI